MLASALGGAPPPTQFASANAGRPAAAPSPGRPRTTGDALRPPTWTRRGCALDSGAAPPPPDPRPRRPRGFQKPRVAPTAQTTAQRRVQRGGAQGEELRRSAQALGPSVTCFKGPRGLRGSRGASFVPWPARPLRDQGLPGPPSYLSPRGGSNRHQANQFMVDCQEACPHSLLANFHLLVLV